MAFSLSEKFEAVMAANDDATALDAVLVDPGFAAIFPGDTVPFDPHSVRLDVSLAPVTLLQTPEQKRRIALLARRVAAGDTQIVTDFDGTVAQFTSDPSASTIDAGCFEGLSRLKAAGVNVVFLTGRETEGLRAMLMAPERVTLDDAGRVTARAPFDGVRDGAGYEIIPRGNRRAVFPVIGSHGAVSQAPDAADGAPAPVEKIKISAAERACIEKSYDIGRALAAKYPALEVNYKADNGVDIHASALPPAERAAAMAEARAALEALAAGPDNPMSDGPASDGRRIFAVSAESDAEVCLRSERLNKAFALTGHGLIDKNKPLLFFCDSLGPEGTDHEAAARINREFPQGLVVQVLNGRSATYPALDAPPAPFALFASPAQLGRFLIFAAQLREREIGLKPAAAQAAPKPEVM